MPAFGAFADLLLVVLGIAILVKCSGIFIDNAVMAARSLGTSEHFIGITLVAVATSLPELAVSVMASIHRNPDIAMGNVLGSNVANIALVLGATLVFFPLAISKSAMKDSMVMVGATILLWVFMFTGNTVGRAEGLVMILAYAAFAVYLNKRREEPDEQTPNVECGKEKGKLYYVVITVLMGLAIVVGANITVRGASGLAEKAGISPLVIGGTIIAVGTSLPELVASVSAGLKKKHGIALGNIIGSNIFNILCVVGAASLAVPLSIDMNRLWTFMTMVLALSVAVMLFATRDRIGRKASVPLLAAYGLFIVVLLGVL